MLVQLLRQHSNLKHKTNLLLDTLEGRGGGTVNELKVFLDAPICRADMHKKLHLWWPRSVQSQLYVNPERISRYYRSSWTPPSRAVHVGARAVLVL